MIKIGLLHAGVEHHVGDRALRAVDGAKLRQTDRLDVTSPNVVAASGRCYLTAPLSRSRKLSVLRRGSKAERHLKPEITHRMATPTKTAAVSSAPAGTDEVHSPDEGQEPVRTPSATVTPAIATSATPHQARHRQRGWPAGLLT